MAALAYQISLAPFIFRQNYNITIDLSWNQDALTVKNTNYQKNPKHIYLSQQPFTCCFWLGYPEGRLNHSTTKQFSLEGTSEGHITPPPPQSNCVRLLRNLFSLFLDIPSEVNSTFSQDSSHDRYTGDINVTSRLELISKYLVKSREFHNSQRKHQIYFFLILLHSIWH